MAEGTNTQTPPTTEAPFPNQKEGRGWLWSLLLGLGILGLIATIPWIGDASDLHTWTLIIMFAVLAQSWNFIGGFTGYSAFGNVAFLLGLPVLRLRGHYFAIATLGIAEVLHEFVAVRNVGGDGGLMSLPLPSLSSDVSFFYAFL